MTRLHLWLHLGYTFFDQIVCNALEGLHRLHKLHLFNKYILLHVRARMTERTAMGSKIYALIANYAPLMVCNGYSQKMCNLCNRCNRRIFAMIPTFSTPDTVHLHLWAADGDALVVPAYRDCGGVLSPPLGWFRAPTWVALAEALRLTRDLCARHCLVVANVPEVVESIAPRLRLNLNIVCDPPTAHWQVIAILAVYYAGCCNAMYAESMPKTEAAWQQHYR